MLLFTPYFFCDLFHQFYFFPLLFLCQFISNLTGCKATLRTQIQTLQRNIFCCFINSVDHTLLIFKFRRLCRDQTKNNFFIRRYFCQRCKSTGSLIIIFQEQCIYIFLCKYIVCYCIIRTTCKKCRVIVSSANVRSDHHIFRLSFYGKVIHFQKFFFHLFQIQPQ